jgi:hypothetical protein
LIRLIKISSASLSEGMQGVIKKSAEYRNTFEPNAPAVSSAPSELIDDDIPF